MPDPVNIDGISYIVDGTGEDGQSREGDDLKEEIRETLASYLSGLSQVNDYPVSDGLKETTYRNADGSPAAIVTGGGTPSDAFSTDTSLESYSNPFLDALAESVKTSDYLEKGVSGHTLLQDVDPTGDGLDVTGKATNAEEGASLPQQQISQVLRSNRFNPTPGSSPFVEGNAEPTSPGRVRSTLGQYDSDDATPVTYEHLRRVALSLMLKATGDDPDGSLNPDDAGVGTLVPSLVQVGSSRLVSKELYARETYQVKDLPRISIESDMPHQSDDDFKSYGNLNSYLEPFDGFLPLGMIALSAIMVPTLIIATEIVFAILAVIINSDGKSIRLDPGPFIPGQYGKPEADGLLSTLIGARALGLAHTEHDFADAAKRGANVFFGFTGDDITSAAADALQNILSSPGYYAVTVRAILRSANTIANAIKDVDFSNPVEGVQAALGLVDVIRSSKIIGFFNAIAGLGDVALTLEDKGYLITSGEKIIISDVDNLLDNPVTRVMKSRSRDGNTAMSLAWRTSATAGAYILPSSMVGAAADYGTGMLKDLLASPLLRQQNDGSTKMVLSDLSRLDADTVKRVEDLLEAEYVPFYFHDLRTNEIVSFHAFLNDLSDSYAADYSEEDAYGRVDSVMIYKKTKREIGLSFHIAATSRQDFDEMWWKINKLTTLVYPQWSKGSVREISDTASFVQPFSQLITSSPLIRLRVGDVLRSNYSKFALARLFGLGTDSFKQDGFTTQRDQIVGTLFTKMSQIQSLIDTVTRDPDLNGEEFGFQAGTAILLPTRGGYYLEADPTSGNVFKQIASIVQSGSARRKLRTIQEYKVTVLERETKDINRGSTPLLTSTKTSYKVQFGEAPDAPPGFEGIAVWVTHADLKIDPSYILDSVDLSTTFATDDVNATQVSEFLDPASNPIVRAFETTKGRGLAGVITSMDFNWIDDQIVWETDVSARAPKMCKVDISFTPVHDIPPGLDADGFNRAPIYPVGDIVNSIVPDVHDSDLKAVVATYLQAHELVFSDQEK